MSQSRLAENLPQSFGISFQWFTRFIRLYKALRMMKHTNLDNTEIALQLNFSEESNMARDFRKELGYTPTKARKLLTDHTPEELLLK